MLAALANIAINGWIGRAVVGKDDGMAVGEQRGNELEEAVRELTNADIVAFGGVGIASALLPATQAYRVIEQMLPDHRDRICERLDWLLSNASPAGRVYAATLLERLDPPAGRAVWSSLREDPAEFTTFTGCVMGRTTVSEYATRHDDTT